MTKNLFDLSGRTVLVGGGSGLIGPSLCRALHDHGAHIIVADVDESRASKLSEELGSNADSIELDITSQESVESCRRYVREEHESLDVLVNNAYPRNENYGARLEDIEFADWNENVRAHLGGYFLMCQKHLPLLRESEGRIINVGSIYGLQAPDFTLYEGTDMTSPAEYSAIKGGIVNLTRYLASYLGEDNVRVNCLVPGGMFDDQPEPFVERYERATPLGRMGTPEDLKGAAVFLASEASGYVTGQTIVVDGGYTVK